MLLKAVRLGEITKRVSIDGEENRPKPGPVVLHRGKEEDTSVEAEEQPGS